MTTGPLTPRAGVKLMLPSGFRLTEPLAGMARVGALTVSWAALLSTSESLALTLTFRIGVL